MGFLHHDAKAERLHTLPLFKDADSKAIDNLANAADEVTVKAGTVLIEQGHHHHDGYVVVSGALSAAVDGQVVGTIGAGEVFGELSLFGHGQASATVTATEETNVLIIPFNRFDKILDETPGMAKAMAIQLAARLHKMDLLHAKQSD